MEIAGLNNTTVVVVILTTNMSTKINRNKNADYFTDNYNTGLLKLKGFLQTKKAETNVI